MEMRIETWIIAFFDLPKKHWFHVFCRKGFEHAFACGFDPEIGKWLYFDWGKDGLHIKAIDGEHMDRLFAHIATKHHAKFVKTSPRKMRVYCPIMPTYCVTAIRHLLGINKPLITPYQLYCALIKMGAEPYLEKQAAEGGKKISA